jgi:hypothetical protein
MSKPSAASTSAVATMSPALTSRFGSGRAQAAPSVPDPGSGNAEAEQDERQDAAG